MMKDRAFGNGLAGHCFETQRLGAELEIIMFLLAARAMLVFHWIGRGAVELDHIRLTSQAKPIGPQRQCPFDAYALFYGPLRLIHLLMHRAPAKRVQILTKSLF